MTIARLGIGLTDCGAARTAVRATLGRLGATTHPQTEQQLSGAVWCGAPWGCAAWSILPLTIPMMHGIADGCHCAREPMSTSAVSALAKRNKRSTTRNKLGLFGWAASRVRLSRACYLANLSRDNHGLVHCHENRAVEPEGTGASKPLKGFWGAEW
jgi:hypothetical protein